MARWGGGAPGRATTPAAVLPIVAMMLAVPALVLPVPLDTDAQGFGHLALAIRESGRIDTLAPLRPGIGYVYAPGALLLFAWTSAVGGGASMPAVMMGVGHACAFLFVWLAWDLGHVIGRRPRPQSTGGLPETRNLAWPWAMVVSAALSVGLWTALLDAHYTAVAGLLFTLACVTSLVRYVRTGHPREAGLAALTLAGVVVTHPDSTMIAVMGLGAFAVAAGVAADRPRFGRLAVALGLIPAGAALLASPWLVTLPRLLQTGVASPFAVSASHWRLLVLYHGAIWPLLAAVGAVAWVRRRPAWALMMLVWLAAVVEFSALGWAERVWPALAAPIVRFHFPFSLAWHGPVIPYLCLGAGGLVWLAGRTRSGVLPVPGASWVLAAGFVAVGAVSGSGWLLEASRGWVSLYGVFATHADLQAMRWIRDHTPRGARVLNYPGDYENRRDWEAHWAPVVTERDCVYFRMQPFFVDAKTGLALAGRGAAPGLAAALAEQQELLAFWRDPADPAQASRLEAAGIDLVLVPESIGDPSSGVGSWRWQPPARLEGVRSTPGDAAYLRLVYRDGGAQVYEVALGGPARGVARGSR
jgi:hypothetical protein